MFENVFHTLVRGHLHPLSHTRGKLPPLLDARQQRFGDTSLPKGSSEQICRCDRVLNGQINPNPAAGDIE